MAAAIHVGHLPSDHTVGTSQPTAIRPCPTAQWPGCGGDADASARITRNISQRELGEQIIVTGGHLDTVPSVAAPHHIERGTSSGRDLDAHEPAPVRLLLLPGPHLPWCRVDGGDPGLRTIQ